MQFKGVSLENPICSIHGADGSLLFISAKPNGGFCLSSGKAEKICKIVPAP
jgi:hypothetical protein